MLERAARMEQGVGRPTPGRLSASNLGPRRPGRQAAARRSTLSTAEAGGAPVGAACASRLTGARSVTAETGADLSISIDKSASSTRRATRTRRCEISCVMMQVGVRSQQDAAAPRTLRNNERASIVSFGLLSIENPFSIATRWNRSMEIDGTRWCRRWKTSQADVNFQS